MTALSQSFGHSNSLSYSRLSTSSVPPATYPGMSDLLPCPTTDVLEPIGFACLSSKSTDQIIVRVEIYDLH